VSGPLDEAPLWQRVLRAPGWRWAPGSSAVHMNWRTVYIREIDAEKGIATCQCTRLSGYPGPVDVAIPLVQLRPDAAGGRASTALILHLLALVREVYADPTITTWLYPGEGGPDRKCWQVWHKARPIAYGVTEAEALVIALERSADEAGPGAAAATAAPLKA